MRSVVLLVAILGSLISASFDIAIQTQTPSGFSFGGSLITIGPTISQQSPPLLVLFDTQLQVYQFDGFGWLRKS